MKNLLYILLLCFCFSATAQYDNSIIEIEDFNFQYISTSINMSVVFTEQSLIEFENDYIMGFVNNNPVTYADQIFSGAAGLPVCGLDGFADYPWWASEGDIVDFFILVDSSIVQVEINPPVIYYDNGLYSLSGYDCMYLNEYGVVPCDFEFYLNNEILNFGCTDSNYLEYQSNANLDDGSCIIIGLLGCMNLDALNYNENAEIDDEQLCIYSQDYVHGLWNEVDDGAIEYEYLQEEYNTLNTNSTNSTSSLQQALDSWNTTIDLDAGWNMFGYGCPTSIDVVEGLSNHTESIEITKDNNGAVYMPEWGFNGIGDFTPGFGYQIKVTEAIEGFSLCDWYVNDIPEDNIVSLQDSIGVLNSEILDLECVNQGACFFNHDLNTCNYPSEGYDCYENSYPYYIGQEAFGGYVFYIDYTGSHGLVAAIEDIGTYQWGCKTEYVEGAYNQYIGSGEINTNAILDQNCVTTGGEPSAAQACINYEYMGYNDWYLPSLGELQIMSLSIGGSAPFLGNGLYLNNIGIGGFYNSYYWSSSDASSTSASGNYTLAKIHSFGFAPSSGSSTGGSKSGYRTVRPIRSF